MPFNHTQLSHVLFQLHMLELNKGKGRHTHKLVCLQSTVIVYAGSGSMMQLL